MIFYFFFLMIGFELGFKGNELREVKVFLFWWIDIFEFFIVFCCVVFGIEVICDILFFISVIGFFNFLFCNK